MRYHQILAKQNVKNLPKRSIISFLKTQLSEVKPEAIPKLLMAEFKKYKNLGKNKFFLKELSLIISNELQEASANSQSLDNIIRKWLYITDNVNFRYIHPFGGSNILARAMLDGIRPFIGNSTEENKEFFKRFDAETSIGFSNTLIQEAHKKIMETLKKQSDFEYVVKIKKINPEDDIKEIQTRQKRLNEPLIYQQGENFYIYSRHTKNWQASQLAESQTLRYYTTLANYHPDQEIKLTHAELDQSIVEEIKSKNLHIAKDTFEQIEHIKCETSIALLQSQAQNFRYFETLPHILRETINAKRPLNMIKIIAIVLKLITEQDLQTRFPAGDDLLPEIVKLIKNGMSELQQDELLAVNEIVNGNPEHTESFENFLRHHKEIGATGSLITAAVGGIQQAVRESLSISQEIQDTLTEIEEELQGELDNLLKQQAEVKKEHDKAGSLISKLSFGIFSSKVPFEDISREKERLEREISKQSNILMGIKEFKADIINLKQQYVEEKEIVSRIINTLNLSKGHMLMKLLIPALNPRIVNAIEKLSPVVHEYMENERERVEWENENTDGLLYPDKDDQEDGDSLPPPSYSFSSGG